MLVSYIRIYFPPPFLIWLKMWAYWTMESAGAYFPSCDFWTCSGICICSEVWSNDLVKSVRGPHALLTTVSLMSSTSTITALLIVLNITEANFTTYLSCTSRLYPLDSIFCPFLDVKNCFSWPKMLSSVLSATRQVYPGSITVKVVRGYSELWMK